MCTTELELEKQVRQLAEDVSNTMTENARIVREKDKKIRELEQQLLQTQIQLDEALHSTNAKKECEDMISKEKKNNDDRLTRMKEEQLAFFTAQEEEHRVVREKLQDFQFVEFDSDESLHEYDRLFSIYGGYLGCGAENLLAFWISIGGTKGWRDFLRPSQLRLLLSREKTTELMYRVTEERLPVKGGTIIPQEEVCGFFSHVLPRLPKLEYLALYECDSNPFDWEAIGRPRLHYTPFPSLMGLDIRFTRAKDQDLLTFTTRVPSLVQYNGCYSIRDEAYFYNGLWIDDWCIEYTTLDRNKLEMLCGRKLLIVC